VNDMRHAIALSLLSSSRLAAIKKAIEATSCLSGDTAEIGIASGGTSKFIALLNGGRCHWACDTFEGLVDCGKEDNGLTNHMFRNEAKETARAFVGLLNVRMVRGYFPESAPPAMKNARYSFVHIDVDTYVSTHAAFAFFAMRMQQGGLIALDDVIERGTPGARSAWSEIAAQYRVSIYSRAAPQLIVHVAGGA
jgi:O-methyltransferase